MSTRHTKQIAGDGVPYTAPATNSQPGGATRSTRTWQTSEMTLSPAMLQARARAAADQKPVIALVGRP
jgi:hypothetical protein